LPFEASVVPHYDSRFAFGNSFELAPGHAR
jgi:hypothetical protein